MGQNILKIPSFTPEATEESSYNRILWSKCLSRQRKHEKSKSLFVGLFLKLPLGQSFAPKKPEQYTNIIIYQW
ncbi:hypothetical protein G9A89_009379 [Geosiphon pyriformis]|nr:hypothetical protein G9A89_009379 [Geosiphon pyriformis]